MVCRELPSSNGSDAGDEPAPKRAKVTSEWVRPEKQMINFFEAPQVSRTELDVGW